MLERTSTSTTRFLAADCDTRDEADHGGGGDCSFGTGSGYTKSGNGAASTGIDFNCNGFLCSENNRCNNNSVTLSLTLSCTCI